MPGLMCATEKLSPGLEREIHDLVTDYYSTTVANTDLPPYNFVWPQYEAMEQIGALVINTARYDTRLLVGVAIYIVLEHPHHAGLICAECDTIATRLAFRGAGIGKRLYIYSEQMLKAKSVQRIMHRYRTVYNRKPMFEDLGFHVVETTYMKELP